MDNIGYLTIAAARAVDPENFDAQVFSAVHAAAQDVGYKVVALAFADYCIATPEEMAA